MKKLFFKKLKFIIPVILILIPAFLFYGPFDGFRVLWINTAMNTSNHKYLATSLYTKSYINKVMKDNVVTTDDKTDPSKIKQSNSEDIIFAEIKGVNYKGYIIKIDDPSCLLFSTSKNEKGELLETIIERENATSGINAGGYISDKTRGLPCGFCIKNGEFINNCEENHDTHTIVGMDFQNKLIVGEFTKEEITVKNYKWAVEFGPILIVNGEKTHIQKTAGGLAPRTAIGQTEKGEILLVVIDGRQVSSIGATYLDLQTVLSANGAVNAICLDGGASSSMIYERKLVNSPSDGNSERLLPNALIF